MCFLPFFVGFHLPAAHIVPSSTMQKYDENRGKTAERKINVMREEYLLSQEQKENNLRIVEFVFSLSVMSWWESS